MKKLILFPLLSLTLSIGCKDKKNDPQPSTSVVSSPTEQKYLYDWDYKKAGDNNVYHASACMTVSEMTGWVNNQGAFNVWQRGKC